MKSNYRPFNLHMISENQSLEKLKSVSDLRKKLGPEHQIFFCQLDFFHVFGIDLAFFRFAGPEIFLRFESDLIFQDLDFQKSSAD